MAEAQYRHEEVAAVPPGYRVRTVTHPSGHQVRIAFPPGARKKGAGKLVAILHPRSEANPCRKRNSLLEAIGAGAAQGLAAAVGFKALGSRLSNRKNGTAAGKFLSIRYLAKQDKFRVETKAGDVLTVSEAWVRRELGPEILAQAKKGAPVMLNRKTGVAEKKFQELWRKYRQRYSPHKAIFLAARHSGFDPHARWLKAQEKERGATQGNPNGSQADGAQLYLEFHGREPREVLELQEQHVKAGEYVALGKMASLWLEPVEGDPSNWHRFRRRMDFEPEDKVKLATDLTGQQLYLLGGNQSLPQEALDALRAAGEDTSKRFVALGLVYALSYIAQKVFDRFKTVEYGHELGEENGLKPMAWYDKESERVLLVGGDYYIAPLDQKIGASPGLAN